MANKELKVRLKQKFDTYENWVAIWDKFIPLKGEICVFEIPSGDASQPVNGSVTPPQHISKTGDGETTLQNLPWDSAIAADVYLWAKAPYKPSYAWSEITGKPTIPTIPNGFANVAVGSTTVAADSTTDTLTLVAGTNITLTPDATNDKITIAADVSNATVTKAETAEVASSLDDTGVAQVKAIKVDSATKADTATTATTANKTAGTLTVTGNSTTAATFNGSAAESLDIVGTGLVTVTGADGKITISTTANNYTLPVAGTSLGGVKSGGVATISSGQITAVSKAASADTATSAGKWTTGRTITLSGDTTGSVTIDGSENVTLSVTVADDSHNHTIANVDNLQTNLDAKAPIASPAFTGTPTAVTAATGTNTTQIATTAFVQSEIASKFKANDAMIFKGTIGTDGTVTALPATHDAGWTYKVITAGTYAGVVCEVGDMIICITDGTTANNAHWTVVQTNVDGAVTGPSSSTDAHVAVFNGTTGKVVKDSGFTIASSVPANAKFTDTTYSTATTSAAGLMSAAMVTKLNGIATGATANTGTVTKVSTGTGLTGGDITSTGTIALSDASQASLALADSAVQSVTVLGHTLSNGGSVTVAQAKTDLGIAAAAAKAVDTSISSTTSTNLPTSKAVVDYVTSKGYVTTDTNTTYAFATGSSNGTISVTPSGGSAQSVSVKGLDASAYKAVDTSISAASTSVNLPTSAAVAAFVEGKGYVTSDNSVQTVALASGTNNGTIKLTVDGSSTDNIAVKGLAAAAYKAVVTSVDSSASLPTSSAVKSFVEGKGYTTNTGTVTSVSADTGLTITGTATTAPTIGFDDSVVFVLDGGSSTVNI